LQATFEEIFAHVSEVSEFEFRLYYSLHHSIGQMMAELLCMK